MRQKAGDIVAPTRRPTGPRTPGGKRRSSRNAIKSGLFAKCILPEESRAEYEALLNGLREDFRPEGSSEAECVESLAWLHWRKRRIPGAESAEIRSERVRATLRLVERQLQWPRNGCTEERSPRLNPDFSQKLASEMLGSKDSESGLFNGGEEVAMLERIFGFLQSGTAFGPNQEGQPSSPAEMEHEEEKITELLNLAVSVYLEQAVKELLHYQTEAQVIPPDKTLDRIVRLDAHLSREIDRTLDRLERFQQRRQGKPALPTLRLETAS